MSELTNKQQQDICVSEIVGSAAAAVAKGASLEMYFYVLVEAAKSAVSVTEGGPHGLALWHEKEAKLLREKVATFN